MSEVTKPILLDETGQSIVTKLDDIKEAILKNIAKADPVKISVVTPPTKTSYLIGETIDLTGIVVCAYFNNDAIVDVTEQCVFTPSQGQLATGSVITATWEWYATGDTFTATTPISVEVVTWASGTDAQIATVLNAHYNGTIDLSDYWNIGDERTVTVSAMEADSPLIDEHGQQDVTFVLANVGGKELVTPINNVDTCAFVVVMKVPLAADNGTNAQKGWLNADTSSPGVGWKDSDRRNWCNTVFYNALPSTTKALFKLHKNISVHGGSDMTEYISEDYFAIPAMKELIGVDDTTYDSTIETTIENKSTQFELYENTSDRTTGTRAFYTRTPDTRDGDTIYTYVYSPGNDSLSASTSASNNAIKVFGVI